MDWYGVSDLGERVQAAWPDAPVENYELLGMLLDVARVQVLTFAEEGAPAEQVALLLENLGYTAEQITSVLGVLGGTIPEPPARYVLAQLQQAKNLFLAGKGTSGPEGFEFSPRPLDKDIQRIIRPRSGVVNVL
jgi:hypothetical protein